MRTGSHITAPPRRRECAGAALRREWEATKARAEKFWEQVQAEAQGPARQRRTDSKARHNFDRCLDTFAERLRHVTVLDPACGSGNFLYVAIHLLLDLEKEVLAYAAEHATGFIPLVRPTSRHGAGAAKELDALRNNWLKPPDWTKTETLESPGFVDGPWKRYVHKAGARGLGTVRFPRTVAKDAASAAKLKQRILTNLYNALPTWLKNAHAALDAGPFAD